MNTIQTTNFKKYCLALACAAVLAPSANAVEIYNSGPTSLHLGGRLFTLYQNYDEDQHRGDGTRHWEGKGRWSDINARVNIYGEHILNSDIKFLANWEHEFNAENNRDERRFAYIGVQSERWGRVQFGQEENMLWNVRTMADIVQESIFDGRRMVGTQDGDNWWNPNTLAYKVWKEKFDLMAAYAFRDGDSKQDTSSFNFSAKYKTDLGLNIGIGYVHGTQEEYDWTPREYEKKEKQNQYWVGTEYQIDNFKFGAVTSYAVIKDPTKGMDDRWLDHEVAGTYTWDKWTGGVVYARRTTDKKGTDNYRGFTGKFTETHAFNYGVSYRPVDRLSIFGVYAHNDSDTSKDTKWHIGAEYWF